MKPEIEEIKARAHAPSRRIAGRRAGPSKDAARNRKQTSCRAFSHAEFEPAEAAAMETSAGRTVSTRPQTRGDEATPASARPLPPGAAIIIERAAREYVRREKSRLYPRTRLAVCAVVDKMYADAIAMTGGWNCPRRSLPPGRGGRPDVPSVSKSSPLANRQRTQQAIDGAEEDKACPRCGRRGVLSQTRRCVSESDCGLTVWRTVVCKRAWTDKQPRNYFRPKAKPARSGDRQNGAGILTRPSRSMTSSASRSFRFHDTPGRERGTKPPIVTFCHWKRPGS